MKSSASGLRGRPHGSSRFRRADGINRSDRLPILHSRAERGTCASDARNSGSLRAGLGHPSFVLRGTLIDPAAPTGPTLALSARPAQESLPPMCSLRFPKKRPISAPKNAVAMIAAPCAPNACHGVENGHAMRQPALIARPAPAPYRAPATVGRVASEFRNTQLKTRTRIPPASVLPIPQAKPMIHGETRNCSLIHGETRRVAVPGLVEKVSRVTNTTTKDAATAAE